jgi:hypothetical protein
MVIIMKKIKGSIFIVILIAIVFSLYSCKGVSSTSSSKAKSSTSTTESSSKDGSSAGSSSGASNSGSSTSDSSYATGGSNGYSADTKAGTSSVSNVKATELNYSYSKESKDFMKFSSADQTFNAFINEFTRRHLRYDEYSIGAPVVGQAAAFAKEWESIALSWFDVSSKVLAVDRNKAMKNYISKIPQDKYGYVWCGFDELEDTVNAKPGATFKQGWPFPDYQHSLHTSRGWEFTVDGQWDGWTASVANKAVKRGTIATTLKNESQVEFISPKIAVNWINTPFLEVDLRMLDKDSFGTNSNIDDIYIYWNVQNADKTSTTWSEDRCVSQKQISTMPVNNIPANFAKQMYFPMYTNPNWKDHVITQIKIVVKGKKALNADINLNYVRMNYDTRQANDMELLITSAKNMYEFTGDKSIIQDNLTRMRKAMQFYLTHLDGSTGMVDADFFVGHDGLRDIGHGIGNGYWDIVCLPSKNLYTNVYFYKTLKAMAYIERMAENEKINIAKPTVLGKDGKTVVQYNETAASLEALAEKVKTNIQNTFWNDKTGRFTTGIDPKGFSVDYGFVQFNLEVVAAGIATPAQQKSILDWISGVRTVETDAAKGKDIYKYEFAPLVNTGDNQDHLYWNWSPLAYGDQLQNGGSVLYVSYYDLISREKVYGIENTFARFKEIQTWYEKVKAAGGQGDMFYNAYYDPLGILVEAPDPGQVGLNFCFPEDAVLYASVPTVFFGLDATEFNTLDCSPNLPKALNYFKIENLMYKNVKYDLSVGNKFTQLNSVRGDTTNLSFRANLKKPTGKFSVYYNGNKITNYTVSNDKVVVTVPLKNGKIWIEQN